MPVKFTLANDVQEPSEEISTWGFRQDLRFVFLKFKSNEQIGDELKLRGVIGRNEMDSESGALYVDCKTKRTAQSFLDRLNAQPEVRNYRLDKSMVVYEVTQQQWERLARWLKRTLTKDQYAAAQKLGIKITKQN